MPYFTLTEVALNRVAVNNIKNEIINGGTNAVPPIWVRVHNGQALVADGHHRLQAFRELGYSRIPIRYLHSSKLGTIVPEGSYIRPLNELLDGMYK